MSTTITDQPGKKESLEIELSNQDHEEPVGCSTGGIVTFSLGLVAGTFSALLCKMAYDTSSEGLDGTTKPFAKPIMMLLLMFAGMVPAIFIWLVQQSFLKEGDRDQISYRTMAILVIPSLCDLLCTLLLLVAQLYITASLWQMMRGSIIVITAILKTVVLDHNLKKHMWLGVSIITFAMLLVASTSFFEPTNETSKDPRVGIVLVLIGCIAQGVQYVFEEKVMAVDNAPPLVVIGCEGIWGTILTLLVVYPVAYLSPGSDNGSFENPFDAIQMIKSSPSLQMLTWTFIVTVTCYNCMAVYVTKYLSAIWHAILDNFRPITIWGLDLAIFYFIFPNQGFGEAWTPSSWLQLVGLLFLFLGTAVYNGSIVQFEESNEYKRINENNSNNNDSIIKTEKAMASPALLRSPLLYKQKDNKNNSNVKNYNSAEVKTKYSNEV